MRRLVALLVLLCALTAASAASARPVVGIADQKPTMFTDARFQALGIKNARLSVAWDALKSRWQVAELDTWLKAARADGVTPLVTWAPSRLKGKRRAYPTPARFAAQFKAFRKRYPWVKTFSTWNEANFCGFGPCRNPGLVARWWVALKHACPSCRILGADVLDLPNAPKWVHAFLHAAHRAPTTWGFHNYVTANRLQTDRTKKFLAATGHAQVWFTETGGIVSRHNHSTIKLPEGVSHAAHVTTFIFSRLARLSPRVTRVYLYQWNSEKHTSWDSGFVTPGGTTRPALTALQKVLGIKSLPKTGVLAPLPLPAVPALPAPAAPPAS